MEQAGLLEVGCTAKLRLFAGPKKHTLLSYRNVLYNSLRLKAHQDGNVRHESMARWLFQPRMIVTISGKHLLDVLRITLQTVVN